VYPRARKKNGTQIPRQGTAIRQAMPSLQVRASVGGKREETCIPNAICKRPTKSSLPCPLSDMANIGQSPNRPERGAGGAKNAYRRRLAEIDEGLEESRQRSDSGRVVQAEEECDFLIRELSVMP